MSSSSVPHFLRFTQALVFVSGLGLPAAALAVGCGGETVATSSSDDAGVADGFSGTVCHGCGISAYDGGVMGTAPYEGDSGISFVPDASVEDGFSGIGLPPDASADAEIEGGGGGPLAPPDLPA